VQFFWLYHISEDGFITSYPIHAQERHLSVISGFRRHVDDICAPLATTHRRMVTLCHRFTVAYRSHFLDPWRWDRSVVPKLRYRITIRRCLISQQSANLTPFVILQHSIFLIFGTKYIFQNYVRRNFLMKGIKMCVTVCESELWDFGNYFLKEWWRYVGQLPCSNEDTRNSSINVVTGYGQETHESWFDFQ
jgi:hypothetical protein